MQTAPRVIVDLTPQYEFVAMRDKLLPDNAFEPAMKLGDNTIGPNTVINQTTNQPIGDGGDGTPGGSEGQAQYNKAGAFEGSVTLSIDDLLSLLRITGNVEFQGSNTIKPVDQTSGTTLGLDLNIAGGKSHGSASGGELNLYGGEGPGGSRGRINLFGGDVIMTFPISSSFFPRLRMATGAGNESHKVVDVINTTDGLFHAFNQFPYVLGNNTSGYVRARIIGRRTGGSAGSTNDTFIAEMFQGYKFTGGTLSLIGSLTYDFFYGDNAVCDAQFAVSLGGIQVQVKGDTNNNYTWFMEMWNTSV